MVVATARGAPAASKHPEVEPPVLAAAINVPCQDADGLASLTLPDPGLAAWTCCMNTGTSTSSADTISGAAKRPDRVYLTIHTLLMTAWGT